MFVHTKYNWNIKYLSPVLIEFIYTFPVWSKYYWKTEYGHAMHSVSTKNAPSWEYLQALVIFLLAVFAYACNFTGCNHLTLG